MARSGSQSAEELDRFTRTGNLVAGIAYVLAHLVLLFDKKAMAEMWPGFLSTCACFGAIAWDERRLRKDRLALAIPLSRVAIHIIAFGPIAVWLHFLRTRWPSGIFRAIGVSILAGLVVMVVDLAMSSFASPEGLEDLPELAIALMAAPFFIAAIWQLLAWLDRLFDLQRVLVGIGLFLVFGSAIGIGIVLHT